jgi:DNA mismatch endonuclease, patch repair protein
VDVKTPEERSKNMAAIKNRNTKPELLLRKKLFKNGLRYRISNNLIGKPDIIFPRFKIAVFVDGCFWHRCPECYKKPENNALFWEGKILSNVRRDKLVNEKLIKDGWHVMRFAPIAKEK